MSGLVTDIVKPTRLTQLGHEASEREEPFTLNAAAAVTARDGTCARDPFYGNAPDAMAYQTKQVPSRSVLRSAKQSAEH